MTTPIHEPIYRPASLEANRARYPEAIRTKFDNRDPTRPLAPLQAANVFDFDDGLRLVVTVELWDDETGPRLHLSASAAPGSTVDAGIRQGWIMVERFKAIAINRFRALSGDELDLTFAGFGTCQEPHWQGTKGGGR